MRAIRMIVRLCYGCLAKAIERLKRTLEVPMILSNTTDDVPSGHTPRVGKGVEMYV